MKKTSNEHSVKGRGSFKNRIYFLMLLVGIGLIVTALYNKDKSTDVADIENENQKEVSADKQTANITEAVSGNSLEGVLNHSDDKNRGNFKVTTPTSDIYIRTSRDFSSLVGLQVLVIISGTLDRFELIDIQPKIEKDGYLLGQ